MIIKLQPDQVILFWEMIKHCVINSYKIPEKYQQDFTLKILEHLLSGMSQCWIGYGIDEMNNKRVHFVLTTKMVDEKFYGIKSLFIDSIYSYRLITEEMVNNINENLEKFAKANNCNVMVAEYTTKRVGEFLISQGFEEHSSICRKILQ